MGLAGVGAIATQSFTDRRYGFRGLELLAGGATPQAALDELRAPDTLAGFPGGDDGRRRCDSAVDRR